MKKGKKRKRKRERERERELNKTKKTLQNIQWRKNPFNENK